LTETGGATLHYNNAISLFKYDLSTASQDERIFSYLLLNSGYLTAIDKNDTHITLSIPNYEVKEELKDVLNTHVKTLNPKTAGIYSKIQNTLNKNQTVIFQANFIKGIIDGNLDMLKKKDLGIQFDDSSYLINPLHLSALSGNIDLFKTVADICKN
jgi:hypothetical protein